MVDPIEVFARADKVELEEFGRHFGSFQSSACRLECLSSYDVDEERPLFRSFLAGEKCDGLLINAEWREIISSATNRSAVIERVRILPTVLTEYIKFEYNLGYKLNNNLGEKIRFLEIAEFRAECVELGALDFWIFDESVCFLMIYDIFGKFLFVVQAAPVDAERYLRLYRKIRDLSKPFSYFEQMYR
jgi:hypothetical protein